MNRAPASVWRRPTHFFAFGLGSGTVPWAPGTFGTLAAIPFYWMMADLTLGWYLALCWQPLWLHGFAIKRLMTWGCMITQDRMG